MCGIIHCKKTNKNETASKLVIKRFEKQKSRGTQGFGYVELKNGYVVAEVRTQTEKEIMEKLTKSTADEIMFHHRYPTSTPNIIESTHPILVSHKSLNYNYYIVHNGMISNDDTLRDDHIKQGFSYTTDLTKQWIARENSIYQNVIWNDSESVAIDLAQAIETGKEMTSIGSIAIVALQFEKQTGKAIAIYYGHNSGNPLKAENDKNFFSLSSETGKDLKIDTLYRFDYETSNITETKKAIGKTYQTSTVDYDYGYGKKWKDDENYRETWQDEEEDFQMELWDEIYSLEEEIQNALDANDIDLALALENDLENLKLDIAENKKLKMYGKF